MSPPRWTHLIRYGEGHTGYATYREGTGGQPDTLRSTGDNVHAEGQIVAMWCDGAEPSGGWRNKAGMPLDVLVRPKKGQHATPTKPHRVLVWGYEWDPLSYAGTDVAPRLLPSIRTEEGGSYNYTPAEFHPTCAEVARMIELAQCRPKR